MHNYGKCKNRQVLHALAGIGTALGLLCATQAYADPIEVPHVFLPGDPIRADRINENYEELALGVSDNDARIAALEAAIAEMSVVPAGAVNFFNLITCPEGWEPLEVADGRVMVGVPAGGLVGATVGSALPDRGLRQITEVPAHSHLADPPSTTTSSAGSHTHTIDPPVTNTTTDGSHTHTVNNGNGGLDSGLLQAANSVGDSDVADSSSPIFSAGSHDHDVDVALFDSGSSGLHSHSLDVLGFSTSTTGVAAVDVTMPYLQLLVCEKL